VKEEVKAVKFGLIVIGVDGLGDGIFVEYWAYLLGVDAVEPRG